MWIPTDHLPDRSLSQPGFQSERSRLAAQHSDAGQQVAKPIGMQDLPFDPIRIDGLQPRGCEADEIPGRRAKIREPDSCGQMGRSRRINVPPVERRAWVRKLVIQRGELDRIRGAISGDQITEQAVVGSDANPLFPGNRQSPAGRPDSRIDNAEKDGLRREIRGGLPQGEGAGSDVSPRDIVGQVEQRGLRGKGGEDASKHAGIGVLSAEIRKQRNPRAGHSSGRIVMVESFFVDSQAGSKPIGVLAAFATGFDRVASRPLLIIPPLVLDLLLWLGPHLRTAGIFGWVQDQVLRAGGLADEQAALVRESLSSLSERFNLLSSLSTLPFGVPSLMAGRMPVQNPLGQGNPLEVAQPALAILLWLSLSALGLGLGAYYQHWIAQAIASGAELGSTWRAALRMVGFGFILFIGAIVTATTVGLAFGVASLILPLFGVGVLYLGLILMFWLAVYLAFTPHGIVRYNLGVIRAMLESIVLVRWNLLSTVGFLLIGFGAYWIMGQIWALPAETSWFSALAVIGHGFVSTTLVAGSYAYYQGRREWLEQARAVRSRPPTA